jgi:hypothetical protein
MNRVQSRFVKLSVVALVGAISLLASEKAILQQEGSLLTTAEARIGRPVTPMSYAGVARRTTRRAVAVGAATAPVVVAPAPVAVAPRTCVQAVDAYGRVYTRCY